MTRDQFTYALTACGCLLKDGKTWYEHDELIKCFEDLGLLGQEPKTGEWIEHFDESGKWYECDQCHTDWGGAVNFCPNCGADMREVEE